MSAQNIELPQHVESRIESIPDPVKKLNERISRLEQTVRDTEQERELLRLQVQQMQEELERYILNAKFLDQELKLTVELLRAVRNIIIDQL